MGRKLHKAGVWQFFSIYIQQFPNQMNVVWHYNKTIHLQFICFLKVIQRTYNYLFEQIFFLKDASTCKLKQCRNIVFLNPYFEVMVIEVISLFLNFLKTANNCTYYVRPVVTFVRTRTLAGHRRWRDSTSNVCEDTNVGRTRKLARNES